MPVKHRTIRSLAMVAAVLLTSGVARADGTGFLVGPTKIVPSLELSLFRTDNLFLESDDPTSDWVTTVSPALTIALPVRPFLLEVEGQLDWRNYAENDSEAATNWSVGGSVGADFPMGLSFQVKTTYSDRYLVRTQEFGAGEDSAAENTSAKVSYTIRDDVRLVLTWFRNSYLFDRSADREHQETIWQASAFWRYQPRLSALLEGGLTGYSYDSNTAQDGSAQWFNLGLSWDVGVKSAGHVKGGYRWKSYDVTNQALNYVDGSYSTVEVGLDHRLTSRTSLDVDVSRMSMESDFPLNPYYLRSEIRAGLEQRFGRRFSDFSAKITAKYGRDEYPEETVSGGHTGTRTDKTSGLGIAVWFDGVRRVRLGVWLSTESRRSTFDTFNYDQTVLGVDLSSRF